MPSDVTSDVAAGKLDRRLFEVSTLLKFGYDDAKTQSTPLIISYGGARATSLRAATVRQELPAIDGAAVSAPKTDDFLHQFGARSAHPVAKIWLDGKRHINTQVGRHRQGRQHRDADGDQRLSVALISPDR
jgi:hypothetical protein